MALFSNFDVFYQLSEFTINKPISRIDRLLLQRESLFPFRASCRGGRLRGET